MKVTFYGHSSFLIELNDSKILLDPFMTDNPMCNADPLGISCDYILISHGHQDHMLDAVAIAKNNDCKVIANYEVSNWLENQGLKNPLDLNIGGKVSTKFGSVKCVNAVHSSSMSDGSYGGVSMGFIIESEGREVYFAGDTALHMDMELIGRHHQLELALLPIGDVFTMGYSDAAIASEMIDCKQVIGMHYDSFPPIKLDHEAAKRAFNEKGAELILMNSGESREF